MGNMVCVCVKNGKLREQRTELVWELQGISYFCIPMDRSVKAKIQMLSLPVQEAGIISLRGSSSCLVHTCFPSKFDTLVLAFNLRLLESHTGREQVCNLSFLRCFKNNTYKQFMFSQEIWHLLYASYIRIWRGHQRK